MANKTHLIVSEDAPSAAPPAVGVHYHWYGAIYLSVGTASADDWVQISGDPYLWSGLAGGVEAPLTLNVERMVRLLVLSKNNGAAGRTSFVFPAYQNVPRGLVLRFFGGTVDSPLPVSLDFSATGVQTTFAVMQVDGVTVDSGNAGVLQLSFTKDIALTLSDFSFNFDGDTVIGSAITLDAKPIPQYTHIP